MASRTGRAGRGLVAAVAAVAVAAGCGGRDGGGSRDTEWPGRGPTVAVGCPSDTDGSIPDSAPTGVVWSALSADVPLLVPASERYGPCRVSDTTAVGYARTPRGALVAAAQIMARSAVPGPMGEETIEQQVVAGPWRDQLAESLDGVDASVAAGVAFIGFSVAAWHRDGARVALAARYDRLPGQVLVWRVDLVWRAGDWRMHPPPDGDWAHALTSMTALPAGYATWGPD